MLTDGRWAVLKPLIEACRPHAKVRPRHLRRTMAAIIWRHENGAKWRAIPAELGPWWMAAQTFIRWSRLGVWERLLRLAQEHGTALGMAFLDGTALRAHQKAAGASGKKTSPRCRHHAAAPRRLAAPAAASAQRRA
jgi:transposase